MHNSTLEMPLSRSDNGFIDQHFAHVYQSRLAQRGCGGGLVTILQMQKLIFTAFMAELQ